MADFTEIIQEINTNLPDNNTQSITAAKLRDTLIDLTEAIEYEQNTYEADVDDKIVFETDQIVGNVSIDQNHLTTYNVDDVNYPTLAKVSDVIQIKNKVAEIDLESTLLTITSVHYAYINGNTGATVPSAAPASYYNQVDVTGYSKIMFNGKQLSSSSVTGWSFYDENEEVVPNSFRKYDQGSSLTLEDKEYTVVVPETAKYFRWTRSMSAYSIDNNYAYGISGNNIASLIQTQLEPVEQEISYIEGDITDINSDLEDVKTAITKYSYTELLDPSIEENQRVNTNGSTQGSTLLDIETFENIDETKKYYLHYTKAGLVTGLYLVNYYNGTQFLGHEIAYTGLTTFDGFLTLEEGTNIIKINYDRTTDQHLYLVESDGYFDLQEMEDKIDEIVPKGNLEITVKSGDKIYIRGKYNETDDILVEFSYFNNFKYVKNMWCTRYLYIGKNTLSNEDLINDSDTIRQIIYDSIGPITMDFCGPIYANHGLCTPRCANPSTNRMTTDAIGSIWHDQVNSNNGSESGKREYKVVNVTNSWIYLVPLIYGEEGSERRDWVYYRSTMPTTLTYISGGSYTTPPDPVSISNAERFDYQMCKCENQKLLIDGVEIDFTKQGNYVGNEVEIKFQQIGYDPVQYQESGKLENGWTPGTATFTLDFTGIPVKAIFDRQYVFSGSYGFLSYAHDTKMNVLMPFELGQTFSGDPNGRYIDFAPVGFLKPDGTNNYESRTYIDKLKNFNANTDFSREFVSNYKSDATVTLSRTETCCVDVNDMPDRLYSYIVDTNTNNVKCAVGSGHSLVRGMSIPSVRNTMINGTFMGWWYPDAYNKLYLPVMTKGDDGFTVTSDFIRLGEGFFCWYNPQLTNSETNARIHTFYYKSGEYYILYIQTTGSHTKEESVLVPSILDGKSIDSNVEVSDNTKIQLLDDVVVSSRLHIKVNAESNTECNYIVLKIK